MTRIVVDDALRSKLFNLTEPLELCNETGQVLARLTPTLDPSRYEALEPQVGDEELKRREQSGEWYTTEQVLAHLNGLERS